MKIKEVRAELLRMPLPRPMQSGSSSGQKEGHVIISADHDSHGIKIDFQNSGTGISKDDLPHIFERFFRADRSRSRDAGGAGIGLAITRELIEAHGGHVGARSVPDKTNIWFVLPC
jgi:two-component system sensor histidine kinase BaeS